MVLSVSTPPRESVAPEAMVMPEIVVRRESVEVASVPALTVTAPANVLATAPPRVREEAPSFTKPPLLMTPLKMAGESVVIVNAPAPRSIAPLNVSVPVLTRSPSVRSPLIRTLLAKVRLRMPSLAMVGSLTQMRPVPKAVFEPA